MKTATETEEKLHLLDLSGCPVAHLDVRVRSDGLTAVISYFLVLKLAACGSHSSARHRHLRPPHAISATSTAQIYTAMEVEKVKPLRWQIGGLLPSITSTWIPKGSYKKVSLYTPKHSNIGSRFKKPECSFKVQWTCSRPCNNINLHLCNQDKWASL